MPYFASHPVRAELPEAQGGLDPPEQCHHVQVFDPSPKEESTVRVASLPRGHLPSRLLGLRAIAGAEVQRVSFFFFFSWRFTSPINSPKPLSFDTCLCFGLSLQPGQTKVLNFLHSSCWVSFKFCEWHCKRRILSGREESYRSQRWGGFKCGTWMGKRNKRASHL